MTSAICKIEFSILRTTSGKKMNWAYQQNNFDLFLDRVVIEIIKITKLILTNKTTMIIKEKILKTINSLIDKISSNKKFQIIN